MQACTSFKVIKGMWFSCWAFGYISVRSEKNLGLGEGSGLSYWKNNFLVLVTSPERRFRGYIGNEFQSAKKQRSHTRAIKGWVEMISFSHSFRMRQFGLRSSVCPSSPYGSHHVRSSFIIPKNVEKWWQETKHMGEQFSFLCEKDLWQNTFRPQIKKTCWLWKWNYREKWGRPQMMSVQY